MLDGSSEHPGSDERVDLWESELRSRQERLRALQSAWRSLAPSGLSSGKPNIAEVGRSLSGTLTDAASLADPAARPELGELDAQLDELEADMRGLALSVSVNQLRSTLPAQVAADRRSVQDLLDLVLGAELAGLEGTQSRIPTVDYLITLLITSGAREGGALQDPMTLTSRLYGLCLQADDAHDPVAAEVEAEFFAAADLQEADLQEELSQRTMRKRKAELGTTYFSPRILRAILAYNLALLQRLEEEVATSQDWGVIEEEGGAPAAAPEEDGVSVFESGALRNLAGALRRRGQGERHSGSELDRVAWSLDLSFARAAERKALLADSVGHREDVRGTVILVGVLCRSASALHDALASIGLPVERLSGEWVEELDAALKAAVERRVAENDYPEACELSELRNRFLHAPITSRHLEVPRPAAPRPSPARQATAPPSTRDLAREAIEQALAQPSRSRPEREAPSLRLASLGFGAVALVALGFFVIRAVLPDAGLASMSGPQLEAVSPYLAKGSRSEEGTGSAFVGRLEERWLALDEDGRLDAAVGLVAALRVRGVDQIMVYDEDGALRIQALGSAAVKVLPPSAP